mmetsp:Transcript_53618/g.151924  ORF Transcript_53618/g.151924 Transcript_53618/m.151924 type:complete len:201 (-) Transcript_53618:943-1545(-)
MLSRLTTLLREDLEEAVWRSSPTTRFSTDLLEPFLRDWGVPKKPSWSEGKCDSVRRRSMFSNSSRSMVPSPFLSTSLKARTISSLVWCCSRDSRSSGIEILPVPSMSSVLKAAAQASFTSFERLSSGRIVAAKNSVYSSEPLPSKSIFSNKSLSSPRSTSAGNMSTMNCLRSSRDSLPSPFLSIAVKASGRPPSCRSSKL